LLFQQPDNAQTTASFIPVANELKRKDKYMNVLFSCHVRKVTGLCVVCRHRGWVGTLLVVEMKAWEAKGEEASLGKL